MKLLTDADTSPLFTDMLADATGVWVKHVRDEGWEGKENGELQGLASERGYTHLVTFDKDMADAHEPSMPVVVVDDPNDDRFQAIDDTEEGYTIRLRRTASAIGKFLREAPDLEIGYHAVLVEGLNPSRKIRRISRNEHDQHPDREENRQRRRQQVRESGRAKAGTIQGRKSYRGSDSRSSCS